MLLVEEHKIKKNADKELFKKCDDYCYRAKNLYNATNYLIKQCDRIHVKLEKGLPLEDWEKEMTDQINEGIRLYNAGRENNRQLRYVDEGNGYISDAYFLSWYLKTSNEYNRRAREFNSAISKFPASWVASRKGRRSKEFFNGVY